MIYPAFLEEKSRIGVTAPSDGNSDEIDYVRLNAAVSNLRKRSYQVEETRDVRTSEKGRSADAKTRAEEFLSLWNQEDMRLIISAKGGDYLMEILPFLDFDEMKKHPVWFQGYSDNTGLTFLITTLCDIASIYGNNFNDFGMETWHPSLSQNELIWKGEPVEQKSFAYCENQFHDRITGLEGYHQDEKVCWRQPFSKQEEVTMRGRLLGGCLDVLLNLCGTRYDKVKEFVNEYQNDGILWFLESFALGSEELARGLWQLREAGWFQNANGFVFGRPCFFHSDTDTSYEEAVVSILGTEKPILFQADIGHRGPRFAVVNGSVGTISYADGKGSLSMEFL